MAAKKKRARPFGESTNSGKKLMMSETKPFGSNPSMKIAGKPARTNGIAQMKGRATKNWSADPNVKRKKN